jgi:glycosyltransferase involved in cell wall biosynthesis
LADAIESVLNQSLADWELVICDNASSDETPHIASQYQDRRIRYVAFKINVPFVYNFNRCLELARGETALLLCADDMLTPNTLELLLAALDENPTAALAIARDRIIIDEQGAQVQPRRSHYSRPGRVPGSEVLRAQCYFRGSVGVESQVLARTRVLIDAGGFDPSTAECCDNDLFCRVCQKWDAVYVAGAAIRSRVHSGTLSHKAQDSLGIIKVGFDVQERLFRTSAALRDQPKYRRDFVKHRVYAWFYEAVALAWRGHVGGLCWLIYRTAKFEPWPWWIPYFVFKYLRGMIHKARRNLFPWPARSTPSSGSPKLQQHAGERFAPETSLKGVRDS